MVIPSQILQLQPVNAVDICTDIWTCI